jgi:transcriptional regulator with XRE-family HTH domain
MKLKITRAWLEKWLAATGGDAEAGAGTSGLEHLKKEVTRRKVTPSALAGASSQLGKAVRFVREKRGWSVNDLARAADVDVAEIERIESSESPQLAPRTAIYLADALGFSRTRMQQFAGHLTVREDLQAANSEYKFAARSKGTGQISDAEYDAIRALVAVLGERDAKD